MANWDMRILQRLRAQGIPTAILAIVTVAAAMWAFGPLRLLTSSALSQIHPAHAVGKVDRTNSEALHLGRKGAPTDSQALITVTFPTESKRKVTSSAVYEDGLTNDATSIQPSGTVDVVYSKWWPDNIHFAGQDRAAWNAYWEWLVALAAFSGILISLAVQNRKCEEIQPPESPIGND